MSNTFDKLSVLDSFIEEVNSYLPDIETNLERLAQSPGDMDALEETHRRTHTIGGSASMMDFPGLAHVAHGMEDILGDALDGLLTLDEPTLGLLRRSLGRLHQLLEGIRSGIDEEAVIAEDDADFARYQASIESSSANVANAENTFSTASGNGHMSASVASFSSAPSFEVSPSLSPASPSMPSFDEVLASFRTQPITQDEDQGWPEEATLVNRFENTSSMSPVSPMPMLSEPSDSTFSPSLSSAAPQVPPAPQSALDALITSTRQTPAISPSSIPTSSPVQSDVSELSSWLSPQNEGYYPAQADPFAQSQSADAFYGQNAASEAVDQPSFHDLTMNDNVQSMPYQQSSSQGGELVPQVYQHIQQDVQSLDTQASSLKDIVAQLRDAIGVIEAQRSEFKGFLNGSKDALDRMEVWAGKAMGLNLRNSPEQVRRFLPLSVMWVSNTKLKKVLDLLNKITSGVKMTDEQLQAAIQQLHSSIQSFGQSVEQSQQSSIPSDQAWTPGMNWSPWEVASNQQSWESRPDVSPLLERVTFERQGDIAALRAEIEAQVRDELQQESAASAHISLGERLALEQQIREEVRNEFAEQQRLREQASGKIDETTLHEIEARIRNEIEIKVRQDFLSQIMAGVDDPSAQASQLTANTTLADGNKQTDRHGVIPPTIVVPFDNIVSPPPPTRSSTATSSPPVDMGSDFGEEAAEIFRLEAEEHLQTISMHVAALEKNPGNRELIQGIRRATHTLKGAAGMMGFRAIADLSHVSEDLLDLIMEGTMSINGQVVSLILDTSEALEMLITGNNAGDVDGKIRELHLRYAALLGERSPALLQVEDLDEDDNVSVGLVNTSTPLQENNQEHPGSQGSRGELSVRVRLQRLDELVNLFGEMLVNRSVLEERLQRLARLVSDVTVSSNRLGDVGQKLESRFEAATLPSGRSVQVMPGEGDQSNTRSTSLPLLTGPKNGSGVGSPAHLSEFDELELDRYTEFHMLARGLSEGISDMATLSAEMDSLIRECEGVFARENRLNTTFQDRLMKVRLVPLSTLGPRLYRASRAVALKQGKDINFVMEGETTEVDRTVYEEIAGPLLHLVRNAVNHGIETPELRQQRGKPPVGQLRVSITYEGNQIMITVRDDGNGLDREHIRQKAISLGLIRPNQQLSEDELISMIFRPGFSTAVVLSEESGRGVGLDVVRDSVSRLRGTLVVESSPGMGTAFTMTFPTSLAIQSAMMVRVADQQFAIPTVHVESIGRLDNFKRANSGGNPAVLVRNDLYPLHRLAQYLSLPGAEILDDKAQLLLVNAGGHRVALVVEEIKGKFDIVMKNLGPHLREVHGIAGGTVLGNGRVILVLELNSLLSTNLRTGSVFSGYRDIAGSMKPRVDVVSNRPQTPMQPATGVPVAESGKHLLVVDDSPSVRRVVSNMLKQHDWTVQTARDGVEALEMISNETPAAVLLDIEMPRMDGYELISTVRAQEQYRTLPLIVLTSRAALKHQQRAISLGASAYVVKPYQDEELLKTINLLVYGAR